MKRKTALASVPYLFGVGLALWTLISSSFISKRRSKVNNAKETWEEGRESTSGSVRFPLLLGKV